MSLCVTRVKRRSRNEGGSVIKCDKMKHENNTHLPSSVAVSERTTEDGFTTALESKEDDDEMAKHSSIAAVSVSSEDSFAHAEGVTDLINQIESAGLEIEDQERKEGVPMKEVTRDLRTGLDEMMDVEQEMQLLKQQSREKDELIARLTQVIGKGVRKREELATENRRLKKEIEGLKWRMGGVELDDEVMAILGGLTIEEMIREDHPDELDALAGHLGWDKGGERNAEGRALFLVLLWDNRDKSDPNPLAILRAKYLFSHRSEVRADEVYECYNALTICVMNPRLTGMLEWLLREGTLDPSVNAALPLAIIPENIPAIKILLDDPRVNKDGYFGYRTPLMDAAEYNNPSVIPVLLEHGCDPGKKHEESGLTALDIATKKGHSEVIAILEAAVAPRLT